MDKLRKAFLDSLARAAKEEMAQVPGLEEQLAHILQQVKEAWPRMSPDERCFVVYLAERMPPDLPAEQRLPSLRVKDLYLAWGCTRRDEAALAVAEQDLQPEVEIALARLDAPAATRIEIGQVLRERLFFGQGGEAPRVSRYSGRGKLSNWIRVTSTRAALKIINREKRQVPVDQMLIQALPDQGYDPELRYLKETYRAEFRDAFRQALHSLTGRERTLLQYQVIDGLSIDKLSAIYHVHRATAARWLEAARKALLVGTRRRLKQGLRIGQEELESIMRLIESNLDLSFRSLLFDPHSPK